MKDYLFPPIILPLFLILIILPFFVLIIVFASSAVFKLVFGVDSEKALLLLAMIVFGSLINIPLYERRGVELIRHYEIFGFIYTVRSKRKLIVAINVGGCLLPIILATKLVIDVLYFIPVTVFLSALIFSSLIIYRFAKPVVGVGIVVPMFVPPLIAAIISYIAIFLCEVPMMILPKLSFCIGVLSAIIGADIMHLRDIERIGYGVVSIGGAGTFDGIFLTGIFAVLFSVFLA